MRRDDMVADIEHVGVSTEPVEPLTTRQLVALVAIGAGFALVHLLVIGWSALG